MTTGLTAKETAVLVRSTVAGRVSGGCLLALKPDR